MDSVQEQLAALKRRYGITPRPLVPAEPGRWVWPASDYKGVQRQGGKILEVDGDRVRVAWNLDGERWERREDVRIVAQVAPILHGGSR